MIRKPGVFLGAAWIALAVAGCATFSPRGPAVGVDGVACVGAVAGRLAGLHEIDNPALLTQAQAASGKGGTCTAKAYSVSAPVVVYRVYDESKPFTKAGRWWALDRPADTREVYRAAYAICPEWSALDRLEKCEIRPGTEVVIGTTQSATCADGSQYPKTADLQVYIPNDGRAGISHVGACTDEGAWP